MPTMKCAATSTVETFVSEDEAIERGWLKVTAEHGSAKERVFWFAPGQAGKSADILVREGVFTREQLAAGTVALVREERIRD